MYFKNYLQRQPGDDDVRNELARTFSWNGEYDSALAMYARILQKNRNNFDARFGTSQVLAWIKDYPGAIREATELYLMFPRNIDLLLFLGKLHFWNGDYTQSLELYQRGIAVDDNNEESLIGKCMVLRQLGRSSEAFEEIRKTRDRFPRNAAIEQLFEELTPRPRNQMFFRYQNEAFDVPDRTDHRTFQAQYYRTLNQTLTVYAELDAYRRFDRSDQSMGIGAYYTPDDRQSLYGYCLVSPDPTVTSSVDAALQYTRTLSGVFSGSIAYRLLNFKTETAHIVTPGIMMSILPGLDFAPRLYVSRTVVTRVTSYAFATQMAYEGLGAFSPSLYYTVGNEAYRGITLDNVESSDSWSVGAGGKYTIGKTIVLKASYQYLNRIGYFRDNSLEIGVGYFW